MARKSAKVLIESDNKKSNKIDRILASDGVWTVYYQNKPFNLRSDSKVAFVAPKYKTTAFNNSGHAINLAKKLNKQFNTTDFTVVLLDHGKTIYPE
jgi:hypothetical protein